MAAEIRCAACGGEIAAGTQFCGLCGARQPPSCTSCGAALVEGAAFCGSCGATLGAAASEAAPPVAPPAPVVPAACGQCGEPLREGARFCRKCGAAAVPGAVAPAGARQQAAQAAAQTQPGSAQAIIDQLTWSSAAAGLGFIIALVSSFLSWASAGGISVAPLDSGARFRLGDILKADSVDGYVVILGALAGLAALVAYLMGRLEQPASRYAVTAVGAGLAALAAIEIQFVSSRPGSIDIGFGLYILVLGGALAFASSWIPARRLKG